MCKEIARNLSKNIVLRVWSQYPPPPSPCDFEGPDRVKNILFLNFIDFLLIFNNKKYASLFIDFIPLCMNPSP